MTSASGQIPSTTALQIAADGSRRPKSVRSETIGRVMAGDGSGGARAVNAEATPGGGPRRFGRGVRHRREEGGPTAPRVVFGSLLLHRGAVRELWARWSGASMTRQSGGARVLAVEPACDDCRVQAGSDGCVARLAPCGYGRSSCGSWGWCSRPCGWPRSCSSSWAIGRAARWTSRSGLAAIGPILVAILAVAWPPVARGDRAFAAIAWLALGAILLLIPSITGLVTQLEGRGPQTLLPSFEAAYPWLLALLATGLFAGLGLARGRLGETALRRRRLVVGAGLGDRAGARRRARRSARRRSSTSSRSPTSPRSGRGSGPRTRRSRSPSAPPRSPRARPRGSSSRWTARSTTGGPASCGSRGSATAPTSATRGSRRRGCALGQRGMARDAGKAYELGQGRAWSSVTLDRAAEPRPGPRARARGADARPARRRRGPRAVVHRGRARPSLPGPAGRRQRCVDRCPRSRCSSARPTCRAGAATSTTGCSRTARSARSTDG